MGSEDNIERIVEYLEGKEKVYPSDISDDLGIEYDEIGEIIEQLKEESIIEDVVDEESGEEE
jgi:transcription initiation factor IIE alpha subunit